jgi:dolichol-phosphate mannosyltransferase
MKRAVIVIPTYNEVKNIESLITAIFLYSRNIENWNISALVVDSNSPDGTAEKVKVIQKKNKQLHLLCTQKEGLGMAYIRGFEHAIKLLQADVVFEIDADMSHDPKEIGNFIKSIENGADMVVGTRYSLGGSIPSDWNWNRKILSIGANIIVRLIFMRMKPTDWTGGYRAIRTWVVQRVMPYIQNYTGYVFQVAFLDKAIINKAKISEIPINFVDRTHGQSKINAPQYVFQTLWYVFTHSSFVRFVTVGGLGAVIDFGLAYTLRHFANIDLKIANAVSAEAAIVFNFIVNNFWSFSHSQIKGGILTYLLNFTKFNVISLGNIIIQIVGISLGVSLFGEDYWLAYKALTIGFVVIPYSYFLYNKIIWKK